LPIFTISTPKPKQRTANYEKPNNNDPGSGGRLQMKSFITIFGGGLFARGFSRLVPLPLQALGGWRRFITPPANFLENQLESKG
jgi:hypothetical protein